MGPAEAYRASRDCSKMAAATVSSNAKKLERRSHIQERIAKLRKESTESPPPRESWGESIGASGLTLKQELFCLFYLETSNASEAYRRAYDVGPDTKPETVNRKAAELLANGKITARISELRAALLKKHEITLDAWLEEHRAIAFGNPREVVDWGETIVIRNPDNGEIVDTRQAVIIKAAKDLSPQALAMVRSIKQARDGGLEVRFHDKLTALASIGRHMGWFEKDNKQKGEAEAEAEALAEVIPDRRDIARAVLSIFGDAVRDGTLRLADQEQAGTGVVNGHRSLKPEAPPATAPATAPGAESLEPGERELIGDAGIEIRWSERYRKYSIYGADGKYLAIRDTLAEARAYAESLSAPPPAKGPPAAPHVQRDPRAPTHRYNTATGKLEEL